MQKKGGQNPADQEPASVVAATAVTEVLTGG